MKSPTRASEHRNAEGKRVAMATSSALVVEGGVRELRKGRLPHEILAGAQTTGDRPR